MGNTSLFISEHFQMQMTLQIRDVLPLRTTTKWPPACVHIQSWSTHPICISSSVLFDNLFQLRKGASKLCIAHFVKVIIDDNSGIKRLILFCRCFFQREDKSWFSIFLYLFFFFFFSSFFSLFFPPFPPFFFFSFSFLFFLFFSFIFLSFLEWGYMLCC